MRILLAEDEHTLGTWLCKALEHGGIHVDWVNSGQLALASVARGTHDAFILDLGLPDMDGYKVLERLRAQDARVPTLILTARGAVSERVRSLNAGADDFLAKPFELAELEARLHALVRRARGSAHPRLACGPLSLDSTTRQFALAGQPLPLSPREHAVLTVLIQRSGEPLSKHQVLERVFADDQDVQLEVIEVIVHRLRKRLEGTPVAIKTYRGLGYALEEA